MQETRSDPGATQARVAERRLGAAALGDRVLVIAFVLFLAAPLAGLALGLGSGTSASETGSVHGRPSAGSVRAALGYPFAWFDYFNDHFGFRQMLIHAHARVSIAALRVSPSTTVIRGRDGWLFYADDGALEDYESAVPLDRDDLAAWRDTIVHTRDWLRARGIAYVFVIAPDKHVIYPEYMPSSVHRLRDEYRMDELEAYMRAHSDVPIVDLRAPLLARKPVERLYHRTDTHWNDRGAFVGYQAILNAVATQVSGVSPLPRVDFTPLERRTPGHDLAQMLGVEDAIGETSLDLAPRFARRAVRLEPKDFREGYEVARVVTEVADPALPRAVVFRDSFCTQLIPFLSEHFSRTVYLWQNEFDPQAVLDEHPRVVIQEMVGRRLQNYYPYDAVAAWP